MGGLERDYAQASQAQAGTLAFDGHACHAQVVIQGSLLGRDNLDTPNELGMMRNHVVGISSGGMENSRRLIISGESVLWTGTHALMVLYVHAHIL